MNTVLVVRGEGGKEGEREGGRRDNDVATHVHVGVV